MAKRLDLGDFYGGTSSMPPLNPLLADRYRALYTVYGVGGAPEIIAVKEKLNSWVETNPGRLREDALYFLLVSAGEMIAKPYSSYIPKLKNTLGKSMSQFRSTEDVTGGLETALTRILENLPESTEPLSARVIMGVMEQQWDELVSVLWWG